jgi:hypothetical protein
MTARLRSLTGAEWCTWAAAAVALIGAGAVLIAPAGGPNRALTAMWALGLAAALLIANALAWPRMGMLGAIVYGIAALALLYAMLFGLSLPLRLGLLGSCPTGVRDCPIGFEHPITAAESFATNAAVASSALALLLVFSAFELRHLGRETRRRKPQPPPPTS